MSAGDDLFERLLRYSCLSIELSKQLFRNNVERHVGLQFMRSATSAGANYEEARVAESRADFIHKLGIVLKELKECRYWLRIIKQSSLLPSKDTDPLLDECEQLIAIMARSKITASGKALPNPQSFS